MYIEKGQIKCFIFSFLGWGLKVTYNLDIFEKFRPPHGVSMSELKVTHRPHPKKAKLKHLICPFLMKICINIPFKMSV